jgi:hypothetical protein
MSPYHLVTRRKAKVSLGTTAVITGIFVSLIFTSLTLNGLNLKRARLPAVAAKKSYIKRAHPLCRKLASSSNTSEKWPVMAASHVWQSFRNELLNASYATQDTENEKFRPWVTELFDWYTTARMERSLSFPASSASMRHILKIIEDYPTTKEPLQVLVMGGSVTAGHGCMDNTIGVKDERTPRGNSPFLCLADAFGVSLEFILFRRRTCRQSH